MTTPRTLQPCVPQNMCLVTEAHNASASLARDRHPPVLPSLPGAQPDCAVQPPLRWGGWPIGPSSGSGAGGSGALHLPARLQKSLWAFLLLACFDWSVERIQQGLRAKGAQSH